MASAYYRGTTVILSQSAPGTLDTAVDFLAAGKLVAIPTETVYGLAADAYSEEAVKAIYTAKGRPSFNPLISHVSGPDMAHRLVQICPLAEKLMAAFWPGPLTLVLPQQPDCPVAPSVSAGLTTLAVRCPKNPLVRSIIDRLDRPIAAPSANPSGRISPTSADDVAEGLGGRIALIIDGGRCPVGIESTIVGVTEGRLILLRPGTVSIDELADAAGVPVEDNKGTTITAPGQMTSHYAPEAAVRLNYDGGPSARLFLLGFGAMDCDLNLSPQADLSEAASNLFHFLRRADKAGKELIAVAPIPSEGVGLAINDRLKRAAAPKDS